MIMLSGLRDEKAKEFSDCLERFMLVLSDLAVCYFATDAAYRIYVKDFLSMQKEAGRWVSLSAADMMERSITLAKGSPVDSGARIYVELLQSDYLQRCAPGGDNLNVLGRSMIVSIYTYWEEKYRSEIARILFDSNKRNEVQSDTFREINRIRQDIIHHRGVSEKASKNEILTFEEKKPIYISRDFIDKLFCSIIDYFNDLSCKNFHAQFRSDYSLSLSGKRRQISVKHAICG